MSVPRIPLRPNADRLWQRLSQAQDAAAHERSSGGAPLVKLDAAVVGRAGERRGRGAHRRIGALVIAGGMAIAAAALVSHRMFQGSGDPARAVGFAADGSANGSEKTLVADARADLPLRFADGSTVTLRAGSSGRMRRPTATGVDIVLERGSFEAHVVHADTTLWLVHAGPYRVRVTGTRFDLTWLASNLDVRLYEGAVVIDGAVLGAGVPLRAGQRLTIAAGVVLIEPLGSATTTTAGASGAARAPVDPPGAPDPAAVEVASGGAGLAVAPGVPS
ncbi:MAG: FecR domain-containing protein, partial [Pseudomonadota bacterium]